MLLGVEMEPSHKEDINGGSLDTSGKNSSNKEKKDRLPIETVSTYRI
jgi:hypothetical protein